MIQTVFDIPLAPNDYDFTGKQTLGINPDLPAEDPNNTVRFNISDLPAGGAQSWTSSTRPTSPAIGKLGYNTDLLSPEMWNGASWRKLSLTTPATGWEGVPFVISATPAPSVGNVGFNTVFAGALPAGYTATGFTPTFSGNDLVMNKAYDLNDLASYNILSSNYINLADNYKYTVNFKYVGAASLEYTLGVYIRSINADFPQSIFGQVALANAGNAGKAIIANNPDASNFIYISSEAAVSLNAGNEMKLEFERKDFLTFVCTITNITTSQVNTVTWTNVLGSGKSTGSIGKLELLAVGSNIAIHSESFKVNEKQHVNLATIGDSITWSQAASSLSLRYANLLNVPAGKLFVAGNGGDGLVELLAGIGQIIALAPKAVTIMMGGNDLLFGRLEATWKAAYNSICTQLRAAGIKIIHLLPTPRDLHSVLPLVDFIQDTYSAIDFVITDTYYAMRDGTQDKLNPDYAGADNLPHPNDAGHAEIARIVNTVLADQIPSLLV